MSTLSFYEFHNIYGFWGKKNIKSNIFFDQNNQLIEISHNSFGARDHEFDLDNKKKNVYVLGVRILGEQQMKLRKDFQILVL